MDYWIKNISKICITILFIGSMTGQSISFSTIADGLSQTISNRNAQMILFGGLIGSGIASKYDQSFQSEVQSNGLMPNGIARVGDYWGFTGQLLLWGSLLNDDNKNSQMGYAVNAFLANGFITYM